MSSTVRIGQSTRTPRAHQYWYHPQSWPWLQEQPAPSDEVPRVYVAPHPPGRHGQVLAGLGEGDTHHAAERLHRHTDARARTQSRPSSPTGQICSAHESGPSSPASTPMPGNTPQDMDARYSSDQTRLTLSLPQCWRLLRPGPRPPRSMRCD